MQWGGVGVMGVGVVAGRGKGLGLAEETRPNPRGSVRERGTQHQRYKGLPTVTEEGGHGRPDKVTARKKMVVVLH